MLTTEDVQNYKIDWNKWHDIVSDCLDAFSFDDAADMCHRMNLTEYDDDDGESMEIKAGEMRRNVERMINVLIALYELHWDGIGIDSDICGYNIFTRCTAFRNTDGQLYATMKLKCDNDSILSEPCIEVRMVSDVDNGCMWFNIDLVAVSQFF